MIKSTLYKTLEDAYWNVGFLWLIVCFVAISNACGAVGSCIGQEDLRDRIEVLESGDCHIEE